MALRADVERVREVAEGDTVELSIERTQFNRQVRDIRASIQQDERFWERAELRQRTISIYDAATILAEEFAAPAGRWPDGNTNGVPMREL